jgi:hypothetical protein
LARDLQHQLSEIDNGLIARRTKMNRQLLQWLGASLLGATLLVGNGELANAQKYWAPSRSTYVGPYSTYYSPGPSYSTYYYGAPTYYRGYSVQRYYNYGPPVTYRSYYGPTYSYGGAYYGLPNAGYYAAPYGGGQVRVGRLRVGW